MERHVVLQIEIPQRLAHK